MLYIFTKSFPSLSGHDPIYIMRFSVYFLINYTIYLHGPMEPTPSPVMSFAWFTWETCVSQVNHAKLITGEGVGSIGAVK